MEKDDTFYEIFGLTREATEGEIKRAYYKLAREYHPDKNPDDPRAEDKFKELTQAYEVLSDPDKRAAYDKFGKDAVTGGGPSGLGSRAMFKVLFGGDVFEDTFGELSFGLMMDKEFTAVPDPYEKEMVMKKLQIQRQNTLVDALLSKIQLYIDSEGGKKKKGQSSPFLDLIAHDIEEKLQVPGGASLLATVGYVYRQEAVKYTGGFLGISGWWEETKEIGHVIKSTFGAVYTAASAEVEIEQMRQEYMSRGLEGEDAIKAEAELEKKIMEKGLGSIWKMGQLEIEAIVRGVAKRCLTDLDKEIPKDIMKKRAQALKIIGDKYKEVGREGKKFEKPPVSHLDGEGKGKNKDAQHDDDDDNGGQQNGVDKGAKGDEEPEETPKPKEGNLDGLD